VGSVSVHMSLQSVEKQQNNKDRKEVKLLKDVQVAIARLLNIILYIVQTDEKLIIVENM